MGRGLSAKPDQNVFDLQRASMVLVHALGRPLLDRDATSESPTKKRSIAASGLAES